MRVRRSGDVNDQPIFVTFEVTVSVRHINHMVSISNLEQTTLLQIHRAFSDAFSDYTVPFTITPDELSYMLKRRGCDMKLSYGAFDNGELVGFILNGIGLWNGAMTAYDTGTGVVKAYRNQGLASKILGEAISGLKREGITQYLLEVIRANTKAYDLYKKAGFEIVREFDYYTSPVASLKINTDRLRDQYQITLIDKPEWALFETFFDFMPSWQNSIDSLSRVMGHLRILAAYSDGRLVGYGIIEPKTGDIPQIAVERYNRRNGIATALFAALISYTETNSVKIINADTACASFDQFAASVGLATRPGQYEMILKL